MPSNSLFKKTVLMVIKNVTYLNLGCIMGMAIVSEV